MWKPCGSHIIFLLALLCSPLAWFEKIDVAKVLVTNGANVNAEDKDGNTPLHSAIVPVAEMLLANGADLRARNAQGERFELLVLRHPEPLPSDSRIPLPRIALLLQDHLAV